MGAALLAPLSVPAAAAFDGERKLTASDGLGGDNFGRSVAISGDTAVVGTPAYYSFKGKAYVFTRAGTAWSQQAKLTASDGATHDIFGASVAVSGDTAVVGAPGDDGHRGAAYVFSRSGATWSQQAKLTAPDREGNDLFGESVAISGDTAVVGTPDDYGQAYFQGSAYVFTRSGATWSEQAKLTAADGAGGDLFGHSVAISGDTAVVGAPGEDAGSSWGAAYTFTRSGATWSEQAKLTAADGAANDKFGFSVAASDDGNTAVVGAYRDDSYTGSAYVFTRAGTAWSQQRKLTASDGAVGDYFGYSVAVSDDGDTALVGAYFDAGDTGVAYGTGSAYVFTRSGTAWSQQRKLTASDGDGGDAFGYSLALSGETAVVGARGDEPNNQGSAYAYQPNHAPVLAPIGDKSVDEGQPLSFTLTASDPDGDTLSFYAEPVPPGATFDNASGVFSWTPGCNQAGSYSVSFGAFDGNLTDTEEIAITVGEDVECPPVVVEPPQMPPIPPTPEVGDTDPPDTMITKKPKLKTRKKRGTFEFIASEPGSTFECSLEGGQFDPCTSPKTLKVKKGKHRFQVRATDAAGYGDPSPASFEWKVKKKKKGK